MEDKREVFRRLALAGLELARDILETYSVDQHDALDRAVRAGAQLKLEFGPIPDFERAELVLVEREGRRHRLGSFDRAKEAVQ